MLLASRILIVWAPWHEHDDIIANKYVQLIEETPLKKRILHPSRWQVYHSTNYSSKAIKAKIWSINSEACSQKSIPQQKYISIHGKPKFKTDVPNFWWIMFVSNSNWWILDNQTLRSLVRRIFSNFPSFQKKHQTNNESVGLTIFHIISHFLSIFGWYLSFMNGDVINYAAGWQEMKRFR